MRLSRVVHVLKPRLNTARQRRNTDYTVALGLSIKAVERIQQYRMTSLGVKFMLLKGETPEPIDAPFHQTPPNQREGPLKRKVIAKDGLA